MGDDGDHGDTMEAGLINALGHQHLTQGPERSTSVMLVRSARTSPNSTTKSPEVGFWYVVRVLTAVAAVSPSVEVPAVAVTTRLSIAKPLSDPSSLVSFQRNQIVWPAPTLIPVMLPETVV